MISANKHAVALKRAADQLLAETDLLAVLARHGEVAFTGSYFYDLMTWRDIDICMSVRGDPMAIVPKIVGRIFGISTLASLYVRNECVRKTQGNPKGVFVCMEFLSSDDELWKVDVLLGASAMVMETIAPGRTLVSRLTARTRQAILRIKSELCTRPDYRRGIRSMDIYDAVIDGGVRTIQEWETWWKKHTRSQRAATARRARTTKSKGR